MSSRPTWANLGAFGVPRDVRIIIYSYLKPIDRLMVEAAHRMDTKVASEKFWCPYLFGDADLPSFCIGECQERYGSFVHSRRCHQKHEILTKGDIAGGFCCNWVILKVECAKYGLTSLLTHFITSYPRLHREHPIGYPLWYNAAISGQTQFMNALFMIYERGNYENNPFYWKDAESIWPITVDVSKHGTVETMIWLRSHNALIVQKCYDKALQNGNYPVANYLEQIWKKCTCGAEDVSVNQGWHCVGCLKKHIVGTKIDRYSVSGWDTNGPWSMLVWERILKKANIGACEYLIEMGKGPPNSYHFRNTIDKWMKNPDKYSISDIINVMNWVEIQGVNLATPELSTLYMLAGGFRVVPSNTSNNPKGKYVKYRSPSLELLEYLKARVYPIESYVQRAVILSDINIFRTLKDFITIVENVAILVAKSGDLRILAELDIGDTAIHEVLAALWNRYAYREFHTYYAKFMEKNSAAFNKTVPPPPDDTN